MDESGIIRQTPAIKREKRVRERDEFLRAREGIEEKKVKVELTILEKLPAHMILHILSLLSTTESWSLSRCNKHLYGVANPLIYPLFKRALDRKMLEICPFSPFKFFPKEYMTDYAITGSLVWGTLLGAKWTFQDIDIFYTSDSQMEELVDKLGFVRNQHGDYSKHVEIEGRKYELYPVVYHGPALDEGFGDCIHVIETREELKWSHLKTVDFVITYRDLQEKISEFDIDGCKSNLHRGVLTIHSPADTLFGRTRACFPNEGRREKYEKQRGITFLGLNPM